MTRLDFELAHYDVVVQYIKLYVTEISSEDILRMRPDMHICMYLVSWFEKRFCAWYMRLNEK